MMIEIHYALEEKYSSYSEQPAGGLRRPIMSSYVLCCCCMTEARLQHHDFVASGVSRRTLFIHQAQAKLLDLSNITYTYFLSGDEALHFRIQGKDVLGNA